MIIKMLRALLRSLTPPPVRNADLSRPESTRDMTAHWRDIDETNDWLIRFEQAEELRDQREDAERERAAQAGVG